MAHTGLPSSASIRIAFWNCRGALSKKPDIELFAETADIIFLAETCVTQFHDYRIRGFESIRLHHVQGGTRGLLVLVKRDISFTQVDSVSIDDPSIEIIILQITSASRPVMVAGIYRHPNMTTPASAYDRIFAILKKSDHFLLIGDFNAHHPLWGSRRPSSAGTILSSVLEDHNCIVLNSEVPTPTYISPPPRSSSVLDLAIASPGVTPLCLLRVGEDPMGSDHRPIHVALSLSADLINVFSHRINIPEKHMKYLCGSLNERADGILSGVADISDQDPIAQYEFFIKSILDVARSLAVPSSQEGRARGVPRSHPQPSSVAPPGARVRRARPPAPPLVER